MKLVHVISNETGGDNGNFGALRDTALGAFFDCGGEGQSFGSQSALLDAEQVWTISVSPDACAGWGGSNDAEVARRRSRRTLHHLR